MTRRSRRSGRGYALELLLIVVAVIEIYAFLVGGGPSAVGRPIADLIGAP
jgi:Tfp pilus assembly protein FimT